MKKFIAIIMVIALIAVSAFTVSAAAAPHIAPLARGSVSTDIGAAARGMARGNADIVARGMAAPLARGMAAPLARGMAAPLARGMAAPLARGMAAPNVAYL